MSREKNRFQELEQLVITMGYGVTHEDVIYLIKLVKYYAKLANERGRTPDQNRHYRAHIVREIAREFGEVEKDVHERLKKKFLPPGKTSTTQLEVPEFTDYTNACIAWANTEYGMGLLYPSDVGIGG